MFIPRLHGFHHTFLVILCLMAAAFPACAAAQSAQGKDAPAQQPPAPVVTAKARTGKAALQNQFIGSIEFPEVSDVAAEVQGRVNAALFEEGDSLAAGQIMVELDNDLLSKELEAAAAQHAQALADLENAKLEFGRMNTLYASKSISEKEFDEARLTMKALQQKAHSFKAEAERLKLEIAKSRIRSPFAGVVLKKHASRGEWVSPGTVVAALARNDVVEAVVEVPQAVLPYLRKGQDVSVSVLGSAYAGTVSAIIPQGNLTTRTFPVKVRIGNVSGLMQGMEAKVSLPAGAEVDAIIVPRDAVISQRGQTTLWTVREGKAEPVPVTIDAWLGSEIAVHGPGLSDGMPVVVKGNERLRPGQPVADRP
ncbi:MAG: efflux RND transporter periplasmic adaptor subunit [Halodesulfovibrio sp.]